MYSPATDQELELLRRELRTDIEHIAGAIGERHLWNGRADWLTQTETWIEAEFRKHYQTVTKQSYVVPRAVFGQLSRDYEVSNLEVQIEGTVEPEKVIVIGAHYDSFPMSPWDREDEPVSGATGTPGANDNGSGIAATLALARYFSGQSLKRTVRFVAFVNEEPPFFRTPYMGSRKYAEACRERRDEILLMITPETIGCYQEKPEPKDRPSYWVAWLFSGMPPDAQHVVFLSDAHSYGMAKWARHVVERHVPQMPVRTACLSIILRNPVLWPVARWFGIFAGDYERAAFERSREIPVGIPLQRWSDDASFWQYGYKAFAVTDTGYLRYKHYHEKTDTPDKINYDRMALVVEGMKAIVDELANPP
jgi:hypothetical protein